MLVLFLFNTCMYINLGHGLEGVLVHPPPHHITKPNFFQAPRCTEH